MIYFSFNGEHDSEENFHVNVSFQAETLNDVLENFKYFLRGLGYNVGELQAVEETGLSSGIDLGDVDLSGLNLDGSTTSYAWDPSHDVQPLSTMNTDTIRPLTIDDLKVMNLNTK